MDNSPISNFDCGRSRNFAFAAAKFRQNLLLIKPEKSFLLLADLVNVDVVKSRIDEFLDRIDVTAGIGTANKDRKSVV